jgi:KaiC/GvpD/RAD55 family RecA-like ATPase
MATGVSVVDDRLDGGVPAGSLVTIVAPAESQSELLLYRLTAQRPTLYVSTVRSEASVKQAFDRTDVDIGSPMVAYAEPDSGFDEIGDVIGRAGTEMNVVLDAANPLERRDAAAYQSFLNRLKTYVQRTGSIAVLHCHRTDAITADPATARGREKSTSIADVVFELRRRVDGSDVDTSLVVSKFRGGRALTEPIKVVLTDDVTVDTSRDLA